MPLGATLPELNEYGALWPFADLMKQAAPLLPRGGWNPVLQDGSDGNTVVGYSWAAGESVAYSPDSGFPLNVPGTAGAVLARVAPQPEAWTRAPLVTPAVLPGRYVLSWQGRGALRVHGDVAADDSGAGVVGPPLVRGLGGVLTANNTAHGAASGGAVALVLRSAGHVAVAIIATNGTDHLRCLRLLPAALHAAGGPARGPDAFSPRFLALAKRFALLRFTSWQREGYSSGAAAAPKTLGWANRTRLDAPSQVRAAGVALEHCIDLALATNASAWLSLPQLATPDYLERMVALLATELLLAPPAWAAGQPPWPGDIYLEYSSGLGMESGQGALVFAAFDAAERGLAAALADAEAAGGAAGWTYATLRGRFKLTMANRPIYFGAVMQRWQAANASAHPFARVDAIALSASLRSETGDDGWESPAANASFWAAQTDAALLSQLRHTMLAADADMNRLAAHVAAFALLPGSHGDDPALAGKEALQWVEGLPARPRLLAYDVGWAFSAPDFGARFYLPSVNATAAQTAAAAAEAAWAERLVALHRSPAVAALLLDFLRRLAAAGYDAAVGTDLLRPRVTNGFAPSLALRRGGNAALAEGWHDAHAAYAAGGAACAAPPAAADFVAVPVAFTAPPSAAALNLSVALAAPLLDASSDGAAGAVACMLHALAAANPKLGALLAYAALPADAAASPATTAALPALLPAPAACAPACVWGTCWEGACVCFAGASGADCAALGRGGAASCGSGSIGMNVGGLSDWSTQHLYVDTHKQSRAWIQQPAFDGYYAWSWGLVETPLIAGDYPAGALLTGTAIGSMMMRDLQGHYPAGWYIVAWDGDGVLSARMTDVVEVRRDAPGRMRVRMQPGLTLNNGMFLRIERSSATDPVRNIRVVMPFPGAPTLLDRSEAREAAGGAAALADAERVLRHAEAFPFHPGTLHLLRNYSTLRFMDLQCTNCDGTPHTWADRARRGDRTYTLGKGAPVEDIVALCNALGANAWVNVPHTADDDFVARFAAALRDGLRPDVRVFVELANEVWGTLFAAGKDAQARGVALGLDALSTLAKGADEARFCYYGMRSRQVFEIFESVWTAAGRRRLSFVVASQAVNADVAKRILSCNASWVAKKADVLAIAPYTNPMMAPSTPISTWTLDHLMQTAFPADLARVELWLREHEALAATFNLSLATYECGQGMGGSTDAEKALVVAANRDPRMRAVYGAYLALLARYAVAPAMLFSNIGLASGYGAWGHLEAVDYDPAVSGKHYGVMAYMANASVAAGGLQCPAASHGECPAGAGDGGAWLACSGRGLCVDAPAPGAASKACSCFEGWSGPACSAGATLDYSTCSYQCDGHGTCVLQRREGFRRYWGCQCNPGYSGERCGIFACPRHCSWNGRCVDKDRCACYDGFGGPDCSIDCGARGRGVCAWQRGIVGAASAAVEPAEAPPAAQCDAGYAFQRVAALLRSPNGTFFAAGACAPVCDCPLATQTCLQPGVCSCAAPCQFGDCIRGACVCWAGYGGRTCTRRVRPHEAARAGGFNALFSPMGVNVDGLAYWSSETPFCDLMKSASGWQTQFKEPWRPFDVWTWSRPAEESPQNLTAAGWPADLQPDQALAALLARDVNRTLPDGRYVVTYDGNGELTFGFDAAVVHERKGRIVLQVRLSGPSVRDNGILLRVADIDPGDPIRNVRVLMPAPSAAELAALLGADAAAQLGSLAGASCEELVSDGFPFHPAYLGFLRGAGFGALRFMPMQATNGGGGWLARWAERPTPEHAFWSERGAPVEVMVHLANALGADAWFNAPHAARDGFHEAFAALVRDTLRPDLAVYLERSNEAWNALFDAGKVLYQEAPTLGLLACELHARLSAAMARAWERVWGAAARQARIVHVLSTQTVNPWITARMLANASVLATVDAVGVTAYIDCGSLGSDANAQHTALQDVDFIFRRCAEELPLISNFWAGQQRAIDAALLAAGVALNGTVAAAPPVASDSGVDARGRGAGRRIALAVYEGGPALAEDACIQGGPWVTPTPNLEDLFTAASRDDRMEHMYRSYLDSFGELGLAGGRAAAHPFMHFLSGGRPSRYGAWGLVEATSASPAHSPKARAVAGYAREVVANVTRTGCMDAAALNFDAAARFSNDSCTFAGVDITAAGAELQPGSLAVALSFPAGALQAAVPISVTQVPVTLSGIAADADASEAGGSSATAIAADAGSLEVATSVYRFGPAGTQFDAPVEVCVALDDAELAAMGWAARVQPDGSAALVPAADQNATVQSLALYYSQNGTSWALCDSSVIRALPPGAAAAANASAQLCGTLRHFTLVAGMAVATEQLQEDATGLAPGAVPLAASPPTVPVSGPAAAPAPAPSQDTALAPPLPPQTQGPAPAPAPAEAPAPARAPPAAATALPPPPQSSEQPPPAQTAPPPAQAVPPSAQAPAAALPPAAFLPAQQDRAPPPSPPPQPLVTVTATLQLRGLAAADAATLASIAGCVAASVGVASDAVDVSILDFPVAASLRLGGVTLAAWRADAPAASAAFAAGAAADLRVAAAAIAVGEPSDDSASRRSRALADAAGLNVPFTVSGFGADSLAAAGAAARVTQLAAAAGSSSLAAALQGAGLPVASLSTPQPPVLSVALTVAVRVVRSGAAADAGATAAAATGDSLLAAVAGGDLSARLSAAGVDAVPVVTALAGTGDRTVVPGASTSAPAPLAAADDVFKAAPPSPLPLQSPPTTPAAVVHSATGGARDVAVATTLSCAAALLCAGGAAHWWRSRAAARGAVEPPRGKCLGVPRKSVDAGSKGDQPASTRAQLLSTLAVNTDSDSSCGAEAVAATALRTPRTSAGLRSRRVSDAPPAPRRSDVLLERAVDGGEAALR
jgi:hypothetical protein